jgi:alpha-D-ribose 1-methylphosphonate 5-triphosphate diphosphatase
MIAITGGSVLQQSELERADVIIDGGEVAEVAAGFAGRLGAMPRIDASGLLVLPGIVDIHGDAFERSIMPRPGVAFEHATALADADRQMLANGITTAFHGVTMSWEPGLRSTGSAVRIIDAMEQAADWLQVDTHVHLRHETFNLEAEDLIADWLAAGRLGCLAFNDHMEGTIKTRNRPDKIRKHIERTGLSDEAFFALVEHVYGRASEVMASLNRLADIARRHDVPLLSHDDMSPSMRDEFRAMGSRIAEFPINAETAANAAAHDDAIVFGAPNVLRGGSHTGCPSAADMVASGLCTALASDYFYPSLLLAPFKLAAEGHASLPAAWDLVSRGPAEALNLRDRGVIADGRRADIILVDPASRGGPAVVAVLIAGQMKFATSATRLSGF